MDVQRLAFALAVVGNMFGVSKDTIGRAADRGEHETIYICGRRMVPLSEVERIKREGLGGRKNARKKAKAQ